MRDPEVQSRTKGINERIAADYAEALNAGATFPPVVVFHFEGVYLLADGWHRLRAYELAGLADIPVEVREGDKRAAVLYAAGSNACHGARRTRADVRRAIVLLLNDSEWRQWSDREIASKCAASPSTVGKLRAQLSKLDSSPRKGKDGKVRRSPKPSKKPKAKDNPAKALKMVKRSLESVRKAWPGTLPVSSLAEVVRDWLQVLEKDSLEGPATIRGDASPESLASPEMRSAAE